jgi:hypothetical protein
MEGNCRYGEAWHIVAATCQRAAAGRHARRQDRRYHTHIPLPYLAPSIPCPASDRCATAVPVGASRRSSPVISRFCSVLGWRTMLQLLARRAAESSAFSVPDRNALWSRAEDGLLVLWQSIVLLTFLVAIGARLHQSCPGALSSSAKSVTGLMILWRN